MAEYTVDVAAEDIVRWLKLRSRSPGPGYDVRATREHVAEDGSSLERAGIAEDEDLVPVVALGSLEVEPAGGAEGWTLYVRVEDPLGARSLEEEEIALGAADIDLDAFEAEFLTPRQGEVYVWAAAESDEAKARLERFLAAVREGRHGPP